MRRPLSHSTRCSLNVLEGLPAHGLMLYMCPLLFHAVEMVKYRGEAGSCWAIVISHMLCRGAAGTGSSTGSSSVCQALMQVGGCQLGSARASTCIQCESQVWPTKPRFKLQANRGPLGVTLVASSNLAQAAQARMPCELHAQWYACTTSPMCLPVLHPAPLTQV